MSDLLVATKLDCTANHAGIRFAVLVGDNHQFYAVSHRSPFFCFEADTRRQAIATARRAIEFFLRAQKRIDEQCASEKEPT